ncbi:thermonuclease family protein [Niabella beijingensis]|nr:thermonuclease family protein [Niabella beijingensis]
MCWYITALFLILTGCRESSGRTDSSRLRETTYGTCYKVTGVKDGDTFVLLMNGREQVVRFAHIDCPEKKQPFGNQAKQFVAGLCFGKYVRLIHYNRYDRNRRLIAEVILEDGRNLNKELVRNGLAWHFKKYSGDTAYAILETAARQQRKGLWAAENPVAPWNWRHR